MRLAFRLIGPRGQGCPVASLLLLAVLCGGPIPRVSAQFGGFDDYGPPPPEKIKWSETCSFAFAHGRILVMVALKEEWVPDMRANWDDVKIEGLDGSSSISLSPRMFRLRNYAETADGSVRQLIYVTPTQTSIETHWHNQGRSQSVIVTQAGPLPGRRRMEPGEVRFTVYGEGVPGGNLSLTCRDMDALRLQYPHEVNRFLRPALRRLDPALMEVDARTIRQVLAPDPPPPSPSPEDPAIVAEVQRLVTDLNAKQFARRVAAQEQLAQLGESAASALRRLDPQKLTAEQNVAIDAILAGDKPVPHDKAVYLRSDVHFLLDCLYTRDAEAFAAVHAELRSALGRDLGVDAKATPDQRGEAIEKLRAELIPKPAE